MAAGGNSSAMDTTEDVEMQEKSNAGDNADDGDNQMTFTGNLTADSEMITVEIDLTDPDDLMRKLDMVDLTDEETDLLLDRAQRLNVWLKRQLMQQEREASSSCQHPGYEPHRHSATCVVSAPAAMLSDEDDDEMGGGQKVSPTVGRTRTFSGSRTGSSTALPPLVGPGRRGSTGLPTASLSSSSSYARDPMAPYYSRYGLGPMVRRPPNIQNSVSAMDCKLLLLLLGPSWCSAGCK